MGQTTAGTENRWRGHLKLARNTKALAYPTLFSKAIRKYGATAFEHQILSVAQSAEELDNLEKIWVILLQTQQPNGYNLQVGGSTWTPDRLEKASSRARVFSPEGRAALVRSGQSRRGCIQPREAVERTAAANRGRVKSSEECAKLAAANLGTTKSVETRAKISAAHLGKKDSPETCAKKSASKSTPQARAENSERVKAQWAAKRAV